MRSIIVSILLLILTIMVPARANATVYMVDVQSCEITQVAAYGGMLEVANVFDPSQYIVFTEAIQTDISACNCPTGWILMTEAEFEWFMSSIETDSDGDGTPNCSDPDDDNDGMPDDWEDQYDLDPLVDDAAGDPDKDGFSNLREYEDGTDPKDPKSHPPRPMAWIPLLLGD